VRGVAFSLSITAPAHAAGSAPAFARLAGVWVGEGESSFTGPV